MDVNGTRKANGFRQRKFNTFLGVIPLVTHGDFVVMNRKNLSPQVARKVARAIRERLCVACLVKDDVEREATHPRGLCTTHYSQFLSTRPNPDTHYEECLAYDADKVSQGLVLKSSTGRRRDRKNPFAETK